MSNQRRQILVTSALPYANGEIHLGHLVEYLQTDIWVRFQKMRGHDCLYVCASDAHGTPIMIRAEQEAITPEALIERVSATQRLDFDEFLVEFDNFHTTHSEENREIVERIYHSLSAAGHIDRHVIEQAYDESKGMFLPDRFVRGTCPRCGAQDQYGDSCEACGATYAPTELLDARSVLSNTPPSLRKSEHLFFRLSNFEDLLRTWIGAGHLHASVASKLQEWFAAGLRDWDISRDAPYFGFAIPGERDKYFYVWLDAPVGYMASFLNLCRRRDDLDFDSYWGADSKTELYHFIGKDIVYFHALFWPAVLAGSGHRMPDGVFVHGFLTVNGQKMSKSRGTFITARTYLDHLQPEYLRYYYAAKLGPGIDDIDLNLEDFVARVNADLVGKIVNIASRCAGFICKLGEGRLAATLHAPALQQEFAQAGESIARAYEQREYSRAMREIMQLADRANQYIDQHKPWVLAKQGERAEVVAVCTQGLNLYRLLITLLKPVLPRVAVNSEAFLRIPSLQWSDLQQPLLDHTIDSFSPLLARIEASQVQALVAGSQQSIGEAAATSPPDAASAPGPTVVVAGDVAAATRAPDPGGKAETELEPIEAEIDIDAFARIDLRVARIEAASLVEGADRLLRLELDIGAGRRQVFAGIRAAYAPEGLIGRHVVVVANLKPRKMRFGESQGMVLAAGPGGEDIFLLAPDSGAQAGMRIR